MISIWSGQISSRPHTSFGLSNGGDCKGNPLLFQGNLGWWNIMNHLARFDLQKMPQSSNLNQALKITRDSEAEKTTLAEAKARDWFQIFFVFTLRIGVNDPIWRAYFFTPRKSWEM